MAIGATSAALGLESFLLPNHLVDGGVVGVAIIGADILHLPLGLLLILFNAPFIYLGYRKLGASFAITSFAGITTLGVLTGLVHSWTTITVDPVLAAIFGGAAIGLGVGLVIRSGGTLDGAEIVAILIDRKSPFTVGEIIMFMNLFIIGGAAFVFGLDRAMYSLIAYFVAYKVIDMTVEGLDESKAAWIVSNQPVLIGQEINEQLNRKVSYITPSGGADAGSEGVILSVITRVEEMRLKALVREIDPKAFIVITNAHDVMGKNYDVKIQ